MAHSLLVCLLIFLGASCALAGELDRSFREINLGEKSLEGYFDRYDPSLNQESHTGRLSFVDADFFGRYMDLYIFPEEKSFADYFKSELSTGLLCPNEDLSNHFDQIRYSYRLITLSYLIEAQWHLSVFGSHFNFPKACSFEVKRWASQCSPKSAEMKKFISRLIDYAPKSDELPPTGYKTSQWFKDYVSQKKLYSHYRVETTKESNIESGWSRACQENESLMNLICSEEDQLWGLSRDRQAYYLLSISNIINTYNKKGEALGCLRRFSETMSGKETRYPGQSSLFGSIEQWLKEKYSERFVQGRVFFYGSSKEFEDKGVSQVHVKDQTLVLAPVEKMSDTIVENRPPQVVAKVSTQGTEPVKSKIQKIPTPSAPKPEVALILKSAFLQAAELRKSQNLTRVDVDMMKLKYDYVFTLNMKNSLSERLKTFMTRDALKEMMNYDHLGTKQGPVPLLFLKFMIDMDEHQGLWNLISVLGTKFYVSNEIDETFHPEAELVELTNVSQGWQITILKNL